MKYLSQNKKAFHDYRVLKKFEAGISLNGQEVKAIKSGRISIKGSYVRIKNNNLVLQGANIPAYQPANTRPGYDAQRERQLLLHKSQIKFLKEKVKEKGLTIVPLAVYTSGKLIKVEIALVRGTTRRDKREKIKKRESDLQIRRAQKRG